MNSIVLDGASAAHATRTRTMKAAVIDRVNSVRLREIAIPEPEFGEAVIKVKFCGICGSDIHVLKGAHPTARFPVVPGHEFVGEFVEAAGPGADRFSRGDLVVAQPFFSCGSCEPCAKGRDNVCRSLRFMGAHTDGAFAQYVRVPTRKVYKLPAGTDLKLAALAEPIAVAVHDVRLSGLQAGESALVVGGGAIGILVAVMARHAGASKVVISELSGYRRRMAEELGFETVNPAEAGLEERALAATDGLGFDVVFEASGSRAGVALSTRLAKITGRIMIIGMTREPYPVDLSAMFAKELVMAGVRIHAQYNFVGAVEVLRSGALNDQFAKVVTDVFPLDKIEDAFAYAQGDGEFLKILVDMQGA